MFAPSNFVPTLYAVADAGVVLSCATAEINANTDGGPKTLGWCAGAATPLFFDLPQVDGGEMALLAVMPSLSVTGKLTLTGERPVILAVYGNADVSGEIVAHANGGRPAAGSSAPANLSPKAHCALGTGGDGHAAATSGGGGGGGAFGTNGAHGGTELTAPVCAGGAAGQANGNATLVPLRGGCAGGNGGGVVVRGAGGRGGGAFQLSVAGTLSISGQLAAPGQGGAGCNGTMNNGAGAGGGGSGGALLLEAYALALASGAVLSCNGGAGGQGDGDPGDPAGGGNPGGDGHVTDAHAAQGGSGGTPSGGNGGNGAALLAAATAGSDTTNENATGGGGGGASVGRIRINVAFSCSLDAGVVTPAPTGNCP
jgi:hypothetical protein